MPMKMRNSFFFFSKGRCWKLNFIFPELWTQTYSSFLENSAAADDFKTAYQKLTLLFLTEKKNKRALLLAVKSLCPHKVGSSGEVYSARWKLMLISDQAWQRLSKKLFGKAGALCLLFDRWLYPGFWINRLCEWRKVSMRLCVWRKRDFFGVIWRCFARVKCGNIMSGFRKCCDCRESHCVIYRRRW